MSEIIPPDEIRGLETPPTTRRDMISEHVKNRSIKESVYKYMSPSKRAVFNEFKKKEKNIGKLKDVMNSYVFVKNAKV